MTRPVAAPRRPRPPSPSPSPAPATKSITLQDAAKRAVERLVELLEHKDPRIALSAARLLLERAPEPERYPKIRKLRGGEIYRGGAEALTGEAAP